jgi:hypothetical protein
MARLRFAVEIVAFWAKEYPVRFLLWVGLFDATCAAGAYVITSEVTSDRALIVAAAVLAGILTSLGLLVVWAFITAPRRSLEIRVGELEGKIQGLTGQMGEFMENQFGEPLRFLPVYHELRTDVREAIRIISRARDTGRLWPRTAGPEYAKWKKHKEAVATNAWARLDGLHGPLEEAFDHVERLSTRTWLRFGEGRRVQPQDDVDTALTCLAQAEAGLDRAIERLEEIERPNQLTLNEEES